MIGRAIVVSMLLVAPSVASECFPDKVEPGETLHGDNVEFRVLDVKNCWVKAIVCSAGKCRPDAYWVHATKIELFKADDKK